MCTLYKYFIVYRYVGIIWGERLGDVVKTAMTKPHRGGLLNSYPNFQDIISDYRDVVIFVVMLNNISCK
jgi:hypothetical protein